MVKAATVFWVDTDAATVNKALFTQAVLPSVKRHLHCFILPAEAEVNRGRTCVVTGTEGTGQICREKEISHLEQEDRKML